MRENWDYVRAKNNYVFEMAEYKESAGKPSKVSSSDANNKFKLYTNYFSNPRVLKIREKNFCARNTTGAFSIAQWKKNSWMPNSRPLRIGVKKNEN